VPWSESTSFGALLGTKVSVNEFLAYIQLGEAKAAGSLSPRSIVIATYALCGFANFGSIAIQIGGIGTIAPSRRADVARLGLKAMIGGAIASWMTAAIAGVLTP
jgi:CNT family concentrative nucleoside transporter